MSPGYLQVSGNRLWQSTDYSCFQYKTLIISAPTLFLAKNYANPSSSDYVGPVQAVLTVYLTNTGPAPITNLFLQDFALQVTGAQPTTEQGDAGCPHSPTLPSAWQCGLLDFQGANTAPTSDGDSRDVVQTTSNAFSGTVVDATNPLNPGESTWASFSNTGFGYATDVKPSQFALNLLPGSHANYQTVGQTILKAFPDTGQGTPGPQGG